MRAVSVVGIGDRREASLLVVVHSVQVTGLDATLRLAWRASCGIGPLSPFGAYRSPARSRTDD